VTESLAQPGPGAAPTSQQPLTSTQADPIEGCPLCGAPLAPDQEWCLRCGAAARTRLAATPNWKAPVATVAVVAALARGVLAAALIKLAHDSGPAPAPTTTTVTTPATAATSTPEATFTQSTTTSTPSTATTIPTTATTTSGTSTTTGSTAVSPGAAGGTPAR
jgi:hypothetical protein